MIPGWRNVLLAAFALLSSACASLGLLRAPSLPAQARARPARYIVVTVSNERRPSAQRAASTVRGYDAAGAYGVTAAASEAVHALERAYGLRQVTGWPIASLRVHCVVFQLPAAAARAELIAQLSHDPRVESAQPLNEFATEGESASAAAERARTRATSSAPSSAVAVSRGPIPGGARAGGPRPQAAWMPYNDPYAPLQWALRRLDVIEAQRQSRGFGVRIAIIDTGIDLRHPDLRGRVAVQRNFVDGDAGQFVRDQHGTEVAGVIAAVANNGIGIVGIAPEARLLAFKACWQPVAAAPRAVCDSFTLAQALEAAILAHADIVNLSLTGPPDPLLARLVREGERMGMLFVGAAPPAGAGFPTDVRGVLSVASMEDGRSGARYLRAPGREILTLVPGGHYDFASGSSLAAAEVSGILALMLSDRPRLPAAAAERILARSQRAATDGKSAGVDACRALVELVGRGECNAAHLISPFTDRGVVDTGSGCAEPRMAPVGCATPDGAE